MPLPSPTVESSCNRGYWQLCRGEDAGGVRKTGPTSPRGGTNFLRDLGLLDALRKSRNTDFMKTTVTVTSRGVVTLPLGLRKALGIKADDTLIAEITPDGLLLRPAVTLPLEIYTDERIREFDESEEELAAAMRRPPATKSARRKRRA